MLAGCLSRNCGCLHTLHAFGLWKESTALRTWFFGLCYFRWAWYQTLTALQVVKDHHEISDVLNDCRRELRLTPASKHKGSNKIPSTLRRNFVDSYAETCGSDKSRTTLSMVRISPTTRFNRVLIFAVKCGARYLASKRFTVICIDSPPEGEANVEENNTDLRPPSNMRQLNFLIPPTSTITKRSKQDDAQSD